MSRELVNLRCKTSVRALVEDHDFTAFSVTQHRSVDAVDVAENHYLSTGRVLVIVATVGVRGRWAHTLDLPTPTSSTDTRRYRCRDGGLVALLCHQARATGSGGPGRRCTTTSAVRSTRRRSTGSGARRNCRCGRTAHARGECPPSHRPTRMLRRWRGRSTSNSTPPLAATRSRVKLARDKRWYAHRPRHVSCQDLGAHRAVDPRTTRSGLCRASRRGAFWSRIRAKAAAPASCPSRRAC